MRRRAAQPAAPLAQVSDVDGPRRGAAGRDCWVRHRIPTRQRRRGSAQRLPLRARVQGRPGRAVAATLRALRHGCAGRRRTRLARYRLSRAATTAPARSCVALAKPFRMCTRQPGRCALAACMMLLLIGARPLTVPGGHPSCYAFALTSRVLWAEVHLALLWHEVGTSVCITSSLSLLTR